MRDRVESVGGTLSVGLDARPRHPDPAGLPAPRRAGARRGRVAEVRARIAWVARRRSPSSLVVADVAVTAQYRSLFSEAAVAVHGFPFVRRGRARLAR